MEIYFCEEDAIKTRLEFIRDHQLTSEDVASIKPGSGGGKYGTLKYGIIDGSESGYIDIVGILSDTGPSAIEMFFGLTGTGYNDIISAIDELVSAGVDKIYFYIESPGGNVGKVDSVWSKIRSLDIETEAVSDSLCASAAYYIASACDKITTTNPLSVWGSIGAVVTGVDKSVALERIGIRVVDVVSENAENKRLGVDTKDGIEAIQAMVNSAERQFIGRISEGRGKPVEQIKETFGRGGIMHAFDYERSNASIFDAIKVGMVDYIVGSSDSAINEDGDILMTDEERKEIEAAATLNANASNVKRLLGICSYPCEVVAIGANVITGDAKIEDFYEAVEKHDAKKKEELSLSIEKSAKEENVLPTQPRDMNSNPPHIVCDLETMKANAADFKRR